MTKNNIRIKVALIGLLSVLAGAIGGAFFEYFLGRQAQIEAERRSEARRAYDNYLSKRDTDPQAALIARYRLLIFADSNVLEKFAEVHRIQAQVSTPREQQRELCSLQTPEAKRIVSAQVRFFSSLREQYLPGDPLSDHDIATVLCPGVGKCYGKIYADHLFDCSEFGLD